MIDVGDIHLADLREERRRRVLVLSNARFHRLAPRVLVAPEVLVAGDPLAAVGEVLEPWRVVIDDAVFAVDQIRSVPVDRLLDHVGRAPASAVIAARRALLMIT